MEYSTSNIVVNSVFRELLVITSDVEVDFKSANVITQKVNDNIDIIYYTDGLYKHHYDKKHCYWFLVNFKESKIRVNYEAEVVALQQQNTDLEAAIAELAYGGAI
ncbi:MAG: hypothetical protein RSD64_04420 [Christensenellaceae bacterium]